MGDHTSVATTQRSMNNLHSMPRFTICLGIPPKKHNEMMSKASPHQTYDRSPGQDKVPHASK